MRALALTINLAGGLKKRDRDSKSRRFGFGSYKLFPDMCRQIGGGDVYQCVFVPGEQVSLARDRLTYLRAKGLFVSFRSHENTFTPLWPLYSHRFSMKRCRKQCHVWVTSLSIVLGIMIVEIILVFSLNLTRWNLCALDIKTWNALWKRSVLECNESNTCSVLQTWHDLVS